MSNTPADVEGCVTAFSLEAFEVAEPVLDPEVDPNALDAVALPFVLLPDAVSQRIVPAIDERLTVQSAGNGTSPENAPGVGDTPVSVSGEIGSKQAQLEPDSPPDKPESVEDTAVTLPIKTGVAAIENRKESPSKRADIQERRAEKNTEPMRDTHGIKTPETSKPAAVSTNLQPAEPAFDARPEALRSGEPVIGLAASANPTRTEMAASTHLQVASSQAQPTVSNQISVAIAETRTGATDLVLSPEELGRVSIRLDPDGDGIVVHVSAERPETQDLIRRNLTSLTQDLQDLGFNDVAFSFGGEGGNHSSQHEPKERKLVSFELSEPVSLAPLAETSGLDLRL